MRYPKNCVIRGTLPNLGDARYVKLSSPSFVAVQEADRWTSKQAQACIDEQVKLGEWQPGQFRVELLQK